MGFAFNFKLGDGSSRGAMCEAYSTPGARTPHLLEENAEVIRVFIGQIYGRETGSLTELEMELTQSGAPHFRNGRYVFAVFDKRLGRLRVWTDKYRLLGAFLITDGTQFIISNDQAFCQSHLQLKNLDVRAVVDLLLFGYVQPPLTLFTNASLLSGYTVADANGLTQSDWREYWPHVAAENPPTAKSLHQAFAKSVADLMHAWRPSVFRMSAGVDTRLVAGVLTAADRARLSFEVVCAPYLNELEDRDVLGAKMMAKAFGVALKVHHFEPEQSAYFSGLANGDVALSGLYGGEFLGGVLLKAWEAHVAVNLDGALELTSELKIDDELVSESRRRFAAAIEKYGARNFLTSVYLGTFRAAIYQSILYGWSNPNMLGQIALSPFSEQTFLDCLLRFPEARIADYSLYGELVRAHLPQNLKGLPFSSPITTFNSDLPNFNDGIDPKFRPHVSETVLPVLTSSLQDVLAAHGIGWDQFPKNHLLNLRLLNLQNGLQLKENSKAATAQE